MIYYAKSSPIETLKEHTNQLLNRLYEYKEIYQSSISELTERDWELLEIAVKYHDIGKVDLVFQKKIRKVIGETGIEPISKYDIPHNILSVMAIPFKELDLTWEEELLVSQAVAFHHERGELPPNEQIAENYRNNICPFIENIEADLGVSIDRKVRKSKMNTINFQNRIRPDSPLYFRYILIKGILHRLDHAASAHVPIELAKEMNVTEYVNYFFSNKLKKEKKPLQNFCERHQNHHLVVVAQTGMGKTEAGLLWLGNKKGFFTLPLRVSINSMYKRILNEKKIGFSKKGEFGEEATGLLHSTSLDYLYDLYEGNDHMLEKVYSQSREFANKLIISTIDQVLKFPFYYLGFEKEFATMATSKVIIDELQAYDPKIAALLIRAMKLIDEIGGSFMIMTATLPDFYFKTLQKELKHSKLPLTYQEFIDDSIKRHHIQVRDSSIVAEEIIDEIIMKGNEKKVLVICNTVDRAREVFKAIDEREVKVNLLHSRFIKKDRNVLEKQILEFAEADRNGIWVTTQLVEASLDIDFDLLFTEMSTLDSQFQRYGRCNRKGEKSVEKINIHVLTEGVSGISTSKKLVYHYDIYERSLNLLKEVNGLLYETKKHQMIMSLYNEQNLEGTAFKREFELTLEQLKDRPHYSTKKTEAQDLLREIYQVQVIPKCFIHDKEFQQVLSNWKEAKVKSERRKYRSQIEAFSVGVNEWKANEIGLSEVEGLKGLYYIHCDYSSEEGLLTEKESFFD